jgi:hypothetical protein
MGGTGALQFCSKNHNLQLIISKRDPLIKQPNDVTADKWGFTIIRRENPRGGARSSSFKYLAPNGKILMFEAPHLLLLPGDYPEPYGRSLEYGTFIKLFEYQLPPAMKTIINFDLYYRLALLLTNVAIPITLYERRSGYLSNSPHIVLSGLGVRLDEDKAENLESGFPSSSEMKILGQEMKVLLYAFKKDKRKKYTRDGIIFTVNGQAHGFLPQSFFERKSVGMSYLADSILVLVDCSKFDGRTREDLFMNSRDRLRDGVVIRHEIEKQLEDLVKNHQGLRALREQRRREEIENKLQDSMPLAEILEKIIKKSPALSRLLLPGARISNPFNLAPAKSAVQFHGRKFPSYFRLSKEYSKARPKACPINKRFRLQFETDAVNEYFDRDQEPGEFSISVSGQAIENFVLNLWNGLATLTVELPVGIKAGDVLLFETEVTDTAHSEPFPGTFYVIAEKPEEQMDSEAGKRKKPPGEDEEDKRKRPSLLGLPQIFELRRNDANWSGHFGNELGALSVRDAGEGRYDFYVNMDNVSLRTEIKTSSSIDFRLLEAQYKYGLALIGMSLLDHLLKQVEKEDEKHGDENGGSIFEKIYLFTEATSSVLLPMIASLHDLEVE